MIKITEISIKEPFKIICTFNTSEIKILDLKKVLDGRNQYAKKILDTSIYAKVKIGEFGELTWENMAKMKDENGELISCAYDISPEFAYHHSVSYGKLEQETH